MSGEGRSPEERERARLEREARRAAREGRPPPSSLPPDAIPPEPSEPVSPPPRREPPSPPPAPPVRSEPVSPPPAPPQRREPPPPPRPTIPPPYEPPPEPPRDYTVHRASGRRTSAHDVLRSRQKPVRGISGRRWLLALLPVGVVALLALWFLVSLFQPFRGEGEGRVTVEIPRGSGLGQIADLLAEREVISSPFFFKARARISGRGGDLKAGRFQLRRDMSYMAALDALAKAPPPDVVRITIPEGRARREVNGIVRGRLKGDYLALTTRSALLDPARYGARGATNLEGFLYPATYDLRRGRPADDLVAMQLKAFKREFAKVDLRAARRKRLTPYDVLTIASMVEREAQIPREQRIIASVIYNRLRRDIPLGIDATIRFATNNWSRPLRESQLRINSPYNTRDRRGLPPGPIGSPGLPAIRAAANPASTDFLFYVVKPGTCGEHSFSRSDVEFERDVNRYNAERNRRGGKSPTDC